MRDIILHNFRCYEEKAMTFRRGINLLIGDNSVGKTSLLRACNLVANSFMCGYSDEFTKWKSAENDDFREVHDDEVTVRELPISIEFHLDENDCPPIMLADETFVFNSKAGTANIAVTVMPVLKIEKESKKNSRNRIGGLIPLRDYAFLLQGFSHHISEDGRVFQDNALPLFAYYTTEDIHTVRKFDKEKKMFKKYPQKPSFGYFESFDSKGLLDCWLKRLLVLREAHKGETEVECVRRAVISALGPDGCGIIRDMEIRVNDGNVYFLYVDGRDGVRSDLLSDGYRRLVSIVIDTAFRCALLNKVMYGEEAYLNTHGTVIIDEIDEHLHPQLQVRILNALHRTFPKIQFIVSTHSPLVMSSVETNDGNVVYKLEYKDGIYSHKELITYGLDATTIMELYMGNVPRDLRASEDFRQLFELIDDERYEDAHNLLEQFKIRYGENPELVRAESMLSFLEG